MLPDLTMMPDRAGGHARDLQRVRELALQKIIEATAVARIRRAGRTKTTPAGEALDYQPGELVDFWRPPRSKDTHAWHGPASVLRSEPSRGQVIVRWRGEEVRVKYGDARKFMDFTGLIYGVLDDSRMPHGQAWEVLERHIATLPRQKCVVFGFTKSKGEWVVTADSRKHRRVTLALEFIVRNLLGLIDVFSAILGNGLSRIPERQDVDYSMLICWETHPEGASHHWMTGAPAVPTSELVGAISNHTK